MVHNVWEMDWMCKSWAAVCENIPKDKTMWIIKSLLALHAVEDEAQEDEGIVAVVNFNIFYHPLTQFSKIAGFWKLALVHEAGPWSNGHSTSVEPLFSHTDRDAFREPQPVKHNKALITVLIEKY